MTWDNLLRYRCPLDGGDLNQSDIQHPHVIKCANAGCPWQADAFMFMKLRKGVKLGMHRPDYVVKAGDDAEAYARLRNPECDSCSA